MSNHSIHGLWTAEFGVPAQAAYGAGVLIFLNGGIYGGDSSYYYVGTYEIEGENITAKLTVKHYFGPRNNVLGPGIGEVELDLKGKFIPDKFTVSNGNFMAVLSKKTAL